VRAAAHAAVGLIGSSMRVDESPRLDHDTENESGTPAIAETIYRKIKGAALFLGDVTFVCEIRDEAGKVKKRIPNPNVMMELGYAAAILGWSRVILVMNKHYGSPESLPFDLRTHSFPVTYDLGPNAERRENVTAALTKNLEDEIRSFLMADHDLVDSTLARLTSYSRLMIKKYGHQAFWEEKTDNTVLSRMDLAIMQMLELNVLRCVDAANNTGVSYVWTYLGKQCCYRLGVKEGPAPVLFQGPQPENMIIDSSFIDVLKKSTKTAEPDDSEGDRTN